MNNFYEILKLALVLDIEEMKKIVCEYGGKNLSELIERDKDKLFELSSAVLAGIICAAVNNPNEKYLSMMTAIG